MSLLQIRHLFISPGHNYFGHHGKPPGEHPMLEMEKVECRAGLGLCGDRFFKRTSNYKGQITFFSWEILERMQIELHLKGVNPSATRRNVIVAGVDLNKLIGKEFELQGIRFAGTEECSPCYWMNRAFKNDATEAWLQGNGGLRARIMTDGILRKEADSIFSN